MTEQQTGTADASVGWYPDLTRPWLQRYWDGTAWSEPYAVPSVGAPAPAPAPRGRTLGTTFWVVALLIAGVSALLLVVSLQPTAGVQGSRAPSQTGTLPPTTTPQGTAPPSASGSAAVGGTRVTSHGVSLVLPKGWRNLAVTESELEDQVRGLAAQNPWLAAAIKAAHDSSAGQLAVFGIRTASLRSGYLDNVYVTVTYGNPGDTDAWPAVLRSTLVRLGAKDVVVRTVPVAGGAGLRLRYVLVLHAGARTTNVAQVVYIALGADRVVAMAVSSRSSATDADAAAMAASIALV